VIRYYDLFVVRYRTTNASRRSRHVAFALRYLRANGDQRVNSDPLARSTRPRGTLLLGLL